MNVPSIPSGTRLCALADVADGTARVVPVGRSVPIVEVIVIRRGGTLLGYHNRCAHQPAPINLLADVYAVSETLVCDNHGARFRVDDGYCIEGPCMGESLAGVPLIVRDGTIVVA